MEKYEFRTKWSTWMWVVILIFSLAAITYGITEKKYTLIILWGIYTAVTLATSFRTYTITPEFFMIKAFLVKPRTFALKDIVEIERKFSTNGKPKCLIIRYMHSGMPHNFMEIRQKDTDISGILQAIIDYYPAVRVI